MVEIELKNISKIYKSGNVKVRALDDVSLKITKGDFVAIVGPSGSGKSTLMHIIGALSKPTHGSYKIAGEEIARKSEKELAILRKNKIGFVFQSFNLISRLSSLSNVELPMVYKRIPRGERRGRALELLKKVGLEKRAGFKPTQLSGGEMQRVAIARSLANNPEIILADEPTGNLDSKSGEEIMAIFKALNNEGITIILVTHEKEEAEFVKRVIKMKDGKAQGEEDVS